MSSSHRREKIRMSEEEIDSFLAGRKTIILTTNGHDDFPHPMPMWFCRNVDGTFDFATYRKSQKIKNIERDDRVSLLAETGTDYEELKAVFVKGRAEIFDDFELARYTLARISVGEPDEMDPEAREALYQGLEPNARKRVVVRVRAEKIISWDHAKLGGVY